MNVERMEESSYDLVAERQIQENNGVSVTKDEARKPQADWLSLAKRSHRFQCTSKGDIFDIYAANHNITMMDKQPRIFHQMAMRLAATNQRNAEVYGKVNQRTSEYYCRHGLLPILEDRWIITRRAPPLSLDPDLWEKPMDPDRFDGDSWLERSAIAWMEPLLRGHRFDTEEFPPSIPYGLHNGGFDGDAAQTEDITQMITRDEYNATLNAYGDIIEQGIIDAANVGKCFKCTQRHCCGCPGWLCLVPGIACFGGFCFYKCCAQDPYDSVVEDTFDALEDMLDDHNERVYIPKGLKMTYHRAPYNVPFFCSYKSAASGRTVVSFKWDETAIMLHWLELRIIDRPKLPELAPPQNPPPMRISRAFLPKDVRESEDAPRQLEEWEDDPNDHGGGVR